MYTTATLTKKQLEKSQNGFVSTPNIKQEHTTTPKPALSLAKELVSVETTQTLSGQCAKFAIFHVNTTLEEQVAHMDGTGLKLVENGIG